VSFGANIKPKDFQDAGVADWVNSQATNLGLTYKDNIVSRAIKFFKNHPILKANDIKDVPNGKALKLLFGDYINKHVDSELDKGAEKQREKDKERVAALIEVQ
jgi:hypothetical protein